MSTTWTKYTPTELTQMSFSRLLELENESWQYTKMIMAIREAGTYIQKEKEEEEQ